MINVVYSKYMRNLCEVYAKFMHKYRGGNGANETYDVILKLTS